MSAATKKGSVLLMGFCAALWCGIVGCKPATTQEKLPPPAQQTMVIFEGVAPEDEVLLKDLLRVDGVLVQGTQYICSINGQICNVGENLKLSTGEHTYTLKLIAITGERVVLSAVGGR